jgi:hypothetical protein
MRTRKKTKKESIRLRSFPVSARLALRVVFVDLLSFRLSLLNSGLAVLPLVVPSSDVA